MSAGVFSGTSQKPYPWVFSPLIDLVFSCGGLFWILVGLHVFFCGGHQQLNKTLPYETGLLLAGGILFANPHIAATLVRLYNNKETRKRLWFHSYVSLLLFIPLVAACIYDQVVLALLIRLYASLTFDHTISQNFGVTLMYCYRSGFRFENRERLCLKVMFHSLTWYAILRQFTYIEFCPKSHLGFKIPLLGPIPEQFCLAALVVLVASTCTMFCIAANKAIKHGQYLPVPALFLVLTTLFMFTAGVELSGGFFLFTPSFFHAAQYLVITTYYNLRETGATAGVAPQDMGKLLFSGENIKYYLSLSLIGGLMFAAIPLVITLLGVSFTTAWAAIFICGGFHHFLVDSAIWRLRDVKVREKLIA